MRDLYERLGLGFGADEAALKRAIGATKDRELAQRAKAVLLDPDRRAAHDAVYLVARRLRDWRVELLMEDGAWAQALADSDLVRPDLPAEPLAKPSASTHKRGARWWHRLLKR
ncbi:hypothetical protein [Silanimonas sp.]|jgi:hypothetical protein|uniref:hypothetical protein n=1 Tax=Silanimonas sp. TaxID=1929290 RepID=UPI0022C24AFD|nr:hypothetical protein [Silanimonas sp.]MCZ8062163.1 hypothetical protein [Silanimonas sp.]